MVGPQRIRQTWTEVRFPETPLRIRHLMLPPSCVPGSPALARRMVAVAACVGIAMCTMPHVAPAQFVYGTPAAPNIPRSVLARYVGEYVYPAGNSVAVRLRNDTLFREIPGQIVPLVPISETRFKLGAVFTAEFVIDSAGGVTQILSDGSSTEFRLPRKSSDGSVPSARTSALPAAVRTAVRVPKSILDRYAGDYEFIPGQMGRTDLIVSVRVKGDTLFGPTQGRLAILTPISETRFRLGSTSLVWEFVVEPGDGVMLIMGTGEQQLRARRKSKP